MTLDTRATAALLMVVIICLPAIGAARAVQGPYGIEGTVTKDVYTSPRGDYRVRIPNARLPEATARDEGDEVGGQVIFTDGLGGFYRVISLESPHGEFTAEDVLGMESYAGAVDKAVVKTARGRELRFVHVEKQGAEITLQTMRKSPDGTDKWELTTPDLVTANAVFEANGRLYHVVAGVAQVLDMDRQRAMTLAKEALEELLRGFELVAPGEGSTAGRSHCMSLRPIPQVYGAA